MQYVYALTLATIPPSPPLSPPPAFQDCIVKSCQAAEKNGKLFGKRTLAVNKYSPSENYAGKWHFNVVNFLISCLILDKVILFDMQLKIKRLFKNMFVMVIKLYRVYVYYTTNFKSRGTGWA